MGDAVSVESGGAAIAGRPAGGASTRVCQYVRMLRIASRMVRVSVVATMVAGTIAPAAPCDARAAAAPRGTILRLRIDSAALHDRHHSVRVYLPASYSTPEARAQRYPVVFMLHGWPGGDGNWPGSGRADITLDSLIATKRIPEVIAVMPDGNGIGLIGRSEYINSRDGASRMEDFIALELPGWVDSTFRTRRRPAMRGILGLSDGGYGAYNIAFRHPGTFGAAASHSGYFTLKNDLSVKNVIGQGETAARIIADNSPLEYIDKVAPRLAGMTIYFDCGTSDEDLASNRALDRKLTALGIAHTYREFPGSHGWGYWKNHLHESLEAITARMW